MSFTTSCYIGSLTHVVKVPSFLPCTCLGEGLPPLLDETLLSLAAQEETELQLPAGTAAPTTRDRGPQKR